MMSQKKFNIMKKIKTFLIIMLAYLSLASFGSDTLYYRFNNYQVVDGAPNDTLIFELEIRSNTVGTYLVGFQTDIYFNTVAFGTNAQPVGITPLTMVGPGLILPLGPANPTNNSFRYSLTAFPPPYNPATLSLVPTTSWGKLIRYKMEVLDNNQLAGMQFNITAMTNNQKFIKVAGMTTTKYVPIRAYNNLLNLPLTLTNNDLLFSEVADPDGSNGFFVELYNAGDSPVDFSIYPWYLTAWDGASYSNVQMTGTIGVGDTWVLGGDPSWFTGAYPGRVADQYNALADGGTTYYYLTTFAPYLSGNLIDLYGGTGSNYTDKHAVRHYDVTSPNPTWTPGEWVISQAGDIDMTPQSHRATLNWDGNPGSEWRAQNNWAEGYIPDAGHDVSILNAGETIPVISFGDNAYCHGLAIGGSGIGLIIESLEEVGDGSLINYGSTSGTASVQRFLKADRFWYVSQPITEATANVFLHTWLKTYDEPSGVWGPYIEDETTPINLMQGYAVWTSSINGWHFDWEPMGDTTTSYDGTLNTGAIGTALTYTPLGSIWEDGWNFVGNPYASAVNWDATGWTKTGLATDSYSIWQGCVGCNDDGGTYGSYSELGGGINGATAFIPAAQGFFVQTNAAGSLGVTNMVRAHDALPFWKSEENMLNRLSLTISNGELNDETVIYFNDGATADLDYSFDAPKLLTPSAPQAYTMLNDGHMAINTFNNPISTPSVIMGINTPETGEYTITASNIESFDSYTEIYLEDLLTGQSINLREVSSYTFSSDEGTSERFVVHFTSHQGIGDKPVSDLTSIYAVDMTVYVNFSAENGDIAIYNILGQEISRTGAVNGLNKISVPQGNAVYIVKVISDNTTVTKKVFVK
jgi:hypothetical protein